jgi:hypothetical protein
MDAWFGVTVERFEYFLEFKMMMLQEALAPVVEQILTLQQQQLAVVEEGKAGTTTEGTNPALFSASSQPTPPIMSLSSGLRVAPRIFLDPTHEFLETIYDGLDDGYTVNDDANTTTKTTTATNELLYGELTPTGVRQLFQLPEVREALQLDSPTVPQQEGDEVLMTRRTAAHGGSQRHSFVDMGSGVGKLIVEAACLLNWPVFLREGKNDDVAADVSSIESRRQSLLVDCIGVELVSSRHTVAVEAVERCGLLLSASSSSSSSPQNFTAAASKMIASPRDGGFGLVRPILGSFFDSFPGEDSAAVCFACALGFDEMLTSRLCDRVLQLVREGSLRCAVLLLRRVPEEHPLFAQASYLPNVPRRRTIHLETTWMNEAPAVLLTFP